MNSAAISFAANFSCISPARLLRAAMFIRRRRLRYIFIQEAIAFSIAIGVVFLHHDNINITSLRYFHVISPFVDAGDRVHAVTTHFSQSSRSPNNTSRRLHLSPYQV